MKIDFIKAHIYIYRKRILIILQYAPRKKILSKANLFKSRRILLFREIVLLLKKILFNWKNNPIKWKKPLKKKRILLNLRGFLLHKNLLNSSWYFFLILNSLSFDYSFPVKNFEFPDQIFSSNYKVFFIFKKHFF